MPERENPKPDLSEPIDPEDLDVLDDALSLAEDVFPNGDMRPDDETEAPEEDDDNAYGDSDEALPDDSEEAAIRRKLKEEE